MDPDAPLGADHALDRLPPDEVLDLFAPLMPSTVFSLQQPEPSVDPLAFSFALRGEMTYPHSCPPLPLSNSPPSDSAPLLELPMNIQQQLLPQPVSDPMSCTSSSQPAVQHEPVPAPPADVTASSSSPALRCRPIMPRTPACSALPTPATPSSHICTPMSALALSESAPQPPPASLPPSLYTPPTTTLRIAKRQKARRAKLPGTPVTPISPSTPPILDRVLSNSSMKTFGTSEHDVGMAFELVNRCVQERAHSRKIKLRKQLKDDSKVTSSQREAKVSRLFHNEVLRGYQGALLEVIGAWYKAQADLHHLRQQQHQSGL
ncbi:hypothetical protein FGB62_58g028 [Gracilaria domingensis]|nr:hypothetical protein FGB62_58g028 [Gracilaria domingensis]